MDISDIIDKRKELEDFVHRNFDSIEYDQVIKPILFPKVNFISKTDHLTFCKMDIEQCWMKKTDRLFAFFMVIKNSAEIEKNVSVRYGKWETKGSISIGDVPLGGDLITWRTGGIYIDVSSYENVCQISKYEMCDLVICGNMNAKQLLEISDNGK